jgi:nucleotide-binding universal stress UspA family protein
MGDVANAVTLEGGVLVGHDGSTAASEAVRWAADLAAALGEPLHVLRAWALLNAPQPPSKVGGFIPPMKDWEAAVKDDLARDVAALGLTGDVHLHVAHAQSAAALLGAARGARMLVVARRGAGGFRGLGFGSTADQVVRHAPGPVVVVPVGGAAG